MYRLGHMVNEQWVEHSHQPVFRLPPAKAPGQRIVAGVPGPEVFLRLSRCLEEPLYLLYVLHTSRGEADVGRYQSPELSLREVESFIGEFEPFLSADGRFDLWAYSPAQGATVVWDRHNLLHAYGPLERYAKELELLGFAPGEPEVPAPHTHHYHSEMDAFAKRATERFAWLHSPLRVEDEQ